MIVSARYLFDINRFPWQQFHFMRDSVLLLILLSTVSDTYFVRSIILTTIQERLHGCLVQRQNHGYYFVFPFNFPLELYQNAQLMNHKLWNIINDFKTLFSIIWIYHMLSLGLRMAFKLFKAEAYLPLCDNNFFQCTFALKVRHNIHNTFSLRDGSFCNVYCAFSVSSLTP